MSSDRQSGNTWNYVPTFKHGAGHPGFFIPDFATHGGTTPDQYQYHHSNHLEIQITNVPAPSALWLNGLIRFLRLYLFEFHR